MPFVSSIESDIFRKEIKEKYYMNIENLDINLDFLKIGPFPGPQPEPQLPEPLTPIQPKPEPEEEIREEREGTMDDEIREVIEEMQGKKDEEDIDTPTTLEETEEKDDNVLDIF